MQRSGYIRPGQLDRMVTLLEPGPTTRSASGAVIMGDPIRHPVAARRRYLTADEQVRLSRETNEQPVRYRFRWIDGVNHKWGLEDENGDIYDIVSVAELGHRDATEVTAILRKN